MAKVFMAILEGMQYAHEQGVIHRDLKPENILLNNDDDIVISDFGLGRMVDAKTSRATFTGQSMGTSGYMAPEQFADAKNATHLSDIFSLGRLLYELYSGHSVSAIQDLKAIPIGISMIVERCTEIDPDKRFQDVDALRTAFTSVLTGRGKKTTGERIQAIVGEAITEGSISLEEVRELAELIAQVQEDADLLHELLMKLPAFVFQLLWEENSIVARLLVKIFADQVSNQGWSFDYTDKIGAACLRLHDATTDHKIRGMLIAAAIEVGVSHNRWRVMDIAAKLLGRKKEPGEGLVVAHAVAAYRHRLNALTDRVQISRLDPAIRDLFAGIEN